MKHNGLNVSHKLFWWLFWNEYKTVDQLNDEVTQLIRENNYEKAEIICQMIAIKQLVN